MRPRLQYELVAVLGLISLVTHNNLFWVAALVLALIDLPDFSSPLGSIARSLERIAGKADAPAVPEPVVPVASEPEPEPEPLAASPAVPPDQPLTEGKA